MNPYTVLGVAPGAGAAAIKAAHRALAGRLHPDREGGNEQRMAEVNVAYELLSDPVRRRAYDLVHPAQKCFRCGGKGFTMKQKGFAVKVPEMCTACKGQGVEP